MAKSAADNLRTSTTQGIKTGRLVLAQTQRNAAANAATAATAVKSGASFTYKPTSGSSDSGSNPTPVKETVVNQEAPVNETKINQQPVRFDDEKLEKMDVDEIDNLLATDGSLTVEEKEALETTKKNKEKESKNSKAPDNTGKWEGFCGDPDWNRPDDSKFDIQQGDFIEFLMKDVVLASAAYVGNKAAGGLGLGAYYAGSLLWHKAWNGKEAKEKDDAERERKKSEERARQAKQQQDQSQQNPPSSKEDRTAVFANNLYTIHDRILENAGKNAREADAYYQTVCAALDLNDADFDKFVATKGITRQDPRAQDALKKAADFHETMQKQGITDPKQVEKEKKNYKDLVAAQCNDHITLATAEQTFTANYTAAAMIEEKAKNPEAFTNGNLDKEFLLKKDSEAKKLFYQEFLKISRGGSEYKGGMKEVVQTSVDAYNKAQENIKKGLYAEQGKQGQNPALQKLQAPMQNKQNPYQNYTAQDMKEIAMAYNKSEDAGKQALDAINNKIAGYEADKENNNERRKRTQETKERIQGQRSDSNQQPAQKTPQISQPIKPKGNER